VPEKTKKDITSKMLHLKDDDSLIRPFILVKTITEGCFL